MKQSKNIRVALDALLTVTIIAAMFVELTGVFLHEVIGFAFFAMLIAHLVLSSAWIANTAKSLGRKKANSRRKGLVVIACLLAVCMVALGISSIAISTILSSLGFAWYLGDYSLWAGIHAVSSYSMCAIVLIHLAMHWTFIANVMRIRHDNASRKAIGAIVYTGAALGSGALGIAAIGEAMLTTAEEPAIAVESEAPGDTAAGNASSQPQATQTPEATQSQQATQRKSRKASRHGEAYQQEQTTPEDEMRQYIESQPGESASAGNDAESSTPLPTGFCTLCRKRCALNAPQCDKPYEAGLITTSQTG